MNVDFEVLDESNRFGDGLIQKVYSASLGLGSPNHFYR
jgi:hypothetical protein